LQAYSIDQQLAKVIMVGLLELVFDQHQSFRVDVPANYVGTERSNLFILP